MNIGTPSAEIQRRVLLRQVETVAEIGFLKSLLRVFYGFLSYYK